VIVTFSREKEKEKAEENKIAKLSLSLLYFPNDFIHKIYIYVEASKRQYTP
jgi:hypothetical protein